ncbi:GNAT family N-acetyltransferase [Lentibacillus lipolyticus]|nr:GNAT family N-acetyltransferase [Lentibacillus lipolyticus]
MAGHSQASDADINVLLDTIKSGGYYLVWEENNVIKGWIGVGKTIEQPLGRKAGMIPELYVFPSYRREGIGQKLCKEACRRLKQEGCKVVQLNVFKGNRARQMYEKLGFNEVFTVMEKSL